MTAEERYRAQEQAIRRMRLEAAAIRVHELGPRALYELILEIGRRNACEADAGDRLLGYAHSLTPEMLRLVGGDRFPPRKPKLVAV